MIQYNFDKIIDRTHTNAAKHSNFERKDRKAQYIPLSVADMDLAVAPVIEEAMVEVSRRGIYGYTSLDADSRYRDSFVSWLSRRFDLAIENETIVFSDGTLELVKSAIYAFTNPGDGIIIQRPAYGSFTKIIENQCNRHVVDARLISDENNYYSIDFLALEEACKQARNKIFLLCSPHNPVGRVWSVEELQQILEICRANDVLLISDEVHADLIRQERKHTPILSLAQESDKIIQIMAISKAFNCAGLSCANGIIPNRRLRQQVQAVHGQRMASPFALEAQVAAYSEEGEKWLNALNHYLDGTIDLVIRYFQEELPSLRINKPEGTYILWMDFKDLGLSPEEIHEAIYEDAKVILQDGTVHDPDEGAYFQRMCIPTPRPLVKEACQRIVTAIKKKI